LTESRQTSPCGSVAVAFATRGRADVLNRVIARLDRQTHAPDVILISCADLQDAGDAATRTNVMIVESDLGLTRQRNAALRALPDKADVVIFFDDDFVAHDTWIEQVVETFNAHPDVAGLTGHVLADGISTQGLSFDEAVSIVDSAHLPPQPRLHSPYSPYGCNMAFRRTAIEGLSFDERLVLYGWQEDRDFGSQVARRGRVAKLSTALGVHMGVKAGRVSGRKFGYSQISNPVYLWRKGNMDTLTAFGHVSKNIASNLVRAPFPEKFVDRYGRLIGNILGINDVLRGKITPERVVDI
jgi:GT2 family glycosyltransferase